MPMPTEPAPLSLSAWPRRRLLTVGLAGAAGLSLLAAAGLVSRASDEEDDHDHSGSGGGGGDNSGPGGSDDDGSGRGRGRGRGRGGDEDENEPLPQVAIPAGAAVVEIFDDDGFTPPSLTVDLGQTVAFVNYDGDEHTATGAGFDTGIIPEAGGLATISLDTPGRYRFACQIHPEMIGELLVRDEDGNVPAAASPVASPAATPAGGTAGGATAVRIANLAFDPPAINVNAGDTVTWTNEDSLPHTVTALDGAFDSGILDPGGTFSQTFDTAGTVAYQCALHPSMTGEVTVA